MLAGINKGQLLQTGVLLLLLISAIKCDPETINLVIDRLTAIEDPYRDCTDEFVNQIRLEYAEIYYSVIKCNNFFLFQHYNLSKFIFRGKPDELKKTFEQIDESEAEVFLHPQCV